MFISRFLRIAIAIASVIIMAAFGSTAARAQCDCLNSISMEPTVGPECCILLSDITIQCDGGAYYPAFPGADPMASLCPGDMLLFPCPCPNLVADFLVAGISIRAGGNLEITYHDCCLHFAISGTGTGCMNIVVGNCELSDLDRSTARPEAAHAMPPALAVPASSRLSK